MKLNTRILIFITVFTVLFLGISAIVYQKSYNALNERILIDASLVATRINKHLQNNIKFIEEDMSLFNVTADLSKYILNREGRAQIESMLKKRFISFFEREYGYKIYENVIIYDVSGNNIASAVSGELVTYPSLPVSSEGKTAVEIVRLKNGRTAISTLIVLKDNQRRIIGFMQGVSPLSALIHGENISLRDLNVRQVDILTYDGKVIYSTALHKPNEKFRDQELFRRLKSGGQVVVETAGVGEKLIVSKEFKHDRSPYLSWTLMLYLDHEQLFSKVLALRWWIAFSMVFIIAISVVFFWLISRSIANPIRTISSAARRIGAGNLSERIGNDLPVDFRVLVKVFNSMAESVEKSQDILEDKVKERTKNLVQANVKLLHEIDERRLIQNELKKSESRLRDAHQLAGLGYWTWDIETGHVDWSDEVYDIFHLSPNVFAPSIDSIMALSPWPDENSRDEELIEIASNDEAKGEFEQKFLRPDGSHGYYQSSFKGEYDDGNLVKIHGTVIDITKRKTAELAFRETSAILQAALDCSPAGIVIADAPDGQLRYVNKAGLGIAKRNEDELVSGVKVEDYVSRWIMLHFDGEPYASAHVPLARALKNGETVNERYILRRPDIEDRIVWAHAAPVYNNGDLVAAVVVFPDITDVVQAEIEIKKSEALLNLAAQSSGLALWEYKKDGNKVTVSDHWYSIRGISKSEWDGSIKQAGERIHPDDMVRIVREIQELQSGKSDKVDIEYRYERNDGIWIWEHVVAKVTERAEDDTILQVMGSLKDVTKKKNIEQQLALSRKMESVGQIAAGIAHEINTPLHYINGNLKFMNSSLPELKNTEDYELLQDLMGAVQDSIVGVDHISKIVRAMKQLSHPGGTGYQKVDLNSIVESVVTITKNEWKYVSDIKCDLDTNLALPTCDPSEISQVVLNLVVNAVDSIKLKYDKSQEQGRIVISSRNKGSDYIELVVEDDGVGIPSNIIHSIFDPFYTTKDVGEGTGQGLAIAYSIVEKHRGIISVESVPGEGAKFILKIPVE
ncbi:ATP-binding protein [Maridesulfovibrio sp.]|uniref:ATP-binding protein n=1 Tax=Maridesulfovibrio sp. TaxID=2795000 RepID=UPI003B0075E2